MVELKGISNHLPFLEYKLDLRFRVENEKIIKPLLIIVAVAAISTACICNSCIVKAEEVTRRVHDPIEINGNSGFTRENGVTSGSGTSSDPYIIEGWSIDASSADGGIYINNTDAYFIIRDCLIYNSSSGRSYVGGIYLHSVTNGKIDGVALRQNYHGIYLQESSNNKIKNCKVYNNLFGIDLYDSSNNNKITNCKVYNNGDGIVLHDSSNNNKITNCKVYNNNTYGILLLHSSNNKITNCKVYNNEEMGIVVWNSSNNKIHYSNIYNNPIYGVHSNYKVNATYNWWGSRNGPGYLGPGDGDGVDGNVLYEPWLNEEVEFEIADTTQASVLSKLRNFFGGLLKSLISILP